VGIIEKFNIFFYKHACLVSKRNKEKESKREEK